MKVFSILLVIIVATCAIPALAQTCAPTNPKTLDFMHARYDMATLGRFLSIDPVIGNRDQPQSWNRYAYVQNNPINRTDPTGKCGESSNFIGPAKPCLQVAKDILDKGAFLAAKPALTDMVGFYNDSPKQVTSATAQLILQGAVGGTVSALTKPALVAASSTSLMSKSTIALIWVGRERSRVRAL
jgi:RHS repeat-associated protein